LEEEELNETSTDVKEREKNKWKKKGEGKMRRPWVVGDVD